jgi:methylated-DNA-[protein]-cysteine S-methyltransferase
MVLDSPIGPLGIETDEHGRLMAIHFGADTRHPASDTCDAVATQLLEYFEGKRRTFDVELALRGTPFQVAVWEELCRIPYGDTITYAELALRVGRPSAVRAVGAANGANPVPVIVPCHRVIGSNGTLTGYGGGIERKQWLLAHEGRRLF